MHDHRDDMPRLRWLCDSPVGLRDLHEYTIARFYITTAQDETPELYFTLANREDATRADGSHYLRVASSGGHRRSAIPLSQVNLERLWDVLTDAARDLDLRQRAYHARSQESENAPAETTTPEMTRAERLASMVVGW